MEPAHTCKAVVLHCIDFRFQKMLNEFLETQFPSAYDRIALAGGVKELLGKSEESIMFKNVQISSQLHQPKTLVLIQHEDCGAYGGGKNFSDAGGEQTFHQTEFQKAEELLFRNFPEMQIEGYYAKLSGEMVAM